MKVKGQLEDAQLHNKATDPTQGTQGRVWINTTDSKAKFDDGTEIKEIATQDQLIASTIANTPSGNIASTDVQSALNELQTEIDTLATSSDLTTHAATTTGVHGTTGALVGTSDSQALTNKIIDADLNTLSNIDNDEIKANAGIWRSKLATGTINHVVINDGTTGTFSSEATLAKSRGGSGQDNSSLTFPASGTLATLAGTETLTNKTLTAPILTDYQEFTEASAPTTPAAGKRRFYLKNDGKLYLKDSTGTETEVGSGGSGVGGINYITNYDASLNTTGWATYADGAALVDGTGGTPTATFTRSTTSPLRGTASFIYTPGALGNGASFDFTIDSADTASMLTIEMDYSIGGTGYTDGLLQCWIYDVTNATLTQPTPYTILNQSVPGKFKSQFQTASNSTSYRLIIHQTTATATYTVKLDNVKVGPTVYAVGPAMSDWTAYTPTFTGAGTVSGVEAYSRRVGQNLQVRVRFTTGTVTATTASVSLGYAGANGNVTIANSGAINTLTIVGSGAPGVNSGNLHTVLAQAGASVVNFSYQAASNPLSAQNGSTIWASSSSMGFYCEVPIAGWSSNTSVSSDSSSRVIAANATGTPTGTLGAAWNTITYPTITKDNAGGFSSGTYIIPTAGTYSFNASARVSATYSAGNILGIRVTKNGTADANSIGSYNYVVYGGGDHTSSVVTPPTDCVAGDVIRVMVFCNATSPTFIADNNFQKFGIVRLAGPAQIQASESINLRRTLSTAQTLNNSVTSIIDMNGNVFDSHNAWRAAAGTYNAASGTWSTTNPAYVVPTSGKYYVNCKLSLNSTAWTVGGVLALNIYKNGSSYAGLSDRRPYSAENYPEIKGSCLVDCIAGDVLDLRCVQASGSNVNLNGSTTNNYVEIYRVG